MSAAPAVHDVTDASFATDVLERSKSKPVVVDFWAPWCGPCRVLGPIIERVAAETNGEVLLAKLNTDENPMTAQQFQIQGIPAVKAFRGGEVVSEFVGAQPRPEVARFFDALVPSEAEMLVAAGDEDSLRAALAIEPARAGAAVPLARLPIARGELDEAIAVLEPVHDDFQADGLRARARLSKAGAAGDALTALDAGEDERAFDLLLAALPDDDVRQVLVGELDRRGPGDPLTGVTRRRLAAALF
jgi:putative thioredoxin